MLYLLWGAAEGRRHCLSLSAEGLPGSQIGPKRTGGSAFADGGLGVGITSRGRPSRRFLFQKPRRATLTRRTATAGASCHSYLIHVLCYRRCLCACVPLHFQQHRHRGHHEYGRAEQRVRVHQSPILASHGASCSARHLSAACRSAAGIGCTGNQ